MTGFSITLDDRVQLHIDRGVATITLEHASTRNSLDVGAAQGLVKACELIDTDSRIGVTVIRGADGTFCSGADRDFLASLRAAQATDILDGLGTIYRALTRFGALSVPTVACLEGAAVGAGLNLALIADLCISTMDAVLIPGFVANGLHPGGGNLQLLERRGGRQAAAALGVFGLSLTALEAKEAGLLWAVVADVDMALPALISSLSSDPALAREIKSSFVLTTDHSSSWLNAIEVEKSRQVWSLSRSHAYSTQG